MKSTFDWLGTIAGALGIAVCLVAGLSRIGGNLHLGGFEAMTVFNVGIAGMVAGCLAKLQAISLKP